MADRTPAVRTQLDSETGSVLSASLVLVSRGTILSDGAQAAGRRIKTKNKSDLITR